MNKFILSFTFFFILVFNVYAEFDDNSSQVLYDSIHFGDEGLVVDLEKIENALANSANPNWINSKNERKRKSILGNFVELVSLSDDPKDTEKGIKAINMLFKYKAKLQYCDGSILYYPISQGQYEIVKILLENGASATFWPKDAIGRYYKFNPIDKATSQGHEKIIDLLVSYGAKKLDKKDAVQLRFIELARFGTIRELREQIKNGAEVNTKNANEETALLQSLSSFYGRYETYIKIMYSLDLGADVNLKGKGTFDITTPLHEAIYYSQFEFKYNRDTSYAEKILQELIKRGAFVSAQDENGKTPLHIAAEYNHLYAAKLLIKSGSKVMPKDKSGKTPLDYAESADMIKLLKESGAKEQ
jgi:ankyrin repeat protein